MKNKIFMKGNWENLIIKSFSCKPKILERYLPNNVELDMYNGKALFSMVAFTFSKVHFFGIKIPFHQLFGEINFRFYVKSKIDGKKGVVFIKEYANKPLIAFMANKIYNEPFFIHKIKQEVSNSTNEKRISYPFKLKNKWQKITALVNKSKTKLKSNSLEEFIVDRYIAFVKGRKNTTYEYQINHKPWQLFKVKETNISNEVLNLLPNEFEKSIELCTYAVDGSEITVEKGILQETESAIENEFENIMI
jgi:uncharacterized protein YqjF (DUF2071 family)